MLVNVSRCRLKYMERKCVESVCLSVWFKVVSIHVLRTPYMIGKELKNLLTVKWLYPRVEETWVH